MFWVVWKPWACWSIPPIFLCYYKHIVMNKIYDLLLLFFLLMLDVFSLLFLCNFMCFKCIDIVGMWGWVCFVYERQDFILRWFLFDFWRYTSCSFLIASMRVANEDWRAPDPFQLFVRYLDLDPNPLFILLLSIFDDVALFQT